MFATCLAGVSLGICVSWVWYSIWLLGLGVILVFGEFGFGFLGFVWGGRVLLGCGLIVWIPGVFGFVWLHSIGC